MPEPERKSPRAAALITLALPGFGHFYAGTWVRGVGIWVGVYVGFMLCMSAGLAGFAGVPVLYGLAAWDAYRMAEQFNEREAVAPAAAGPASIPLLVLWAACRSVWILAIFLYALTSAVAIVDQIIRHGPLSLMLLGALPGLVALFAAWLAGRDTWKGLTRQSKHTAGAMRDEASATILVGALAAAAFAICWPMFSQLIRFSGEGAMKGNLAGVRQAIARYKDAHAGAAPPSLEAALDQALPKVPLLWSSSSVGSHPSTSETIVLPDRTGTDSGKWGYVVSLSSPELGGVAFIDCTHTDAKGSVWTSY